MGRRGPAHLDARGQRLCAILLCQRGQAAVHLLYHVVTGGRLACVDCAVFPAKDVEAIGLDLDAMMRIDADEQTALGAGFADVPPLRVAGEGDGRVVAQPLLLVDVAQGPVVVMLCAQVFHRAWGIGLVALAARGRRVQQADVKHPRHGGRIAGARFSGHGRLREALPVDRHVPLGQADRFGLLGGKETNVVGQRQSPGHLVGRVVVAGDEEDGDAGLAQPDHLRDEEQARAEFPPIAVVQVAGDEDELDGLGEGQLDQVLQGPARGLACRLDRGALIAFQAAQGAVEVKIGGMDKPRRRASHKQ